MFFTPFHIHFHTLKDPEPPRMNLGPPPRNRFPARYKFGKPTAFALHLF